MSDADDYTDHDHEWVDVVLPQRFDWFALVPIATTFASAVAQSVTGVFSSVDDLAQSHAYWRIDRAEFLNDVREDFERIWESQPET